MKDVKTGSKRIYYYSGAVSSYDRIVCNNYRQQTFAVSAKQAENNIKYRYRMENGMEKFVPITLMGKVSAEPFR